MRVETNGREPDKYRKITKTKISEKNQPSIYAITWIKS